MNVYDTANRLAQEIKQSEEYEKYIDNFFVLLAPEKSEKIKCAACSYKDKFSISFTSVFKDDEIGNKGFINFLKGVDIK